MVDFGWPKVNAIILRFVPTLLIILPLSWLFVDTLEPLSGPFELSYKPLNFLTNIKRTTQT